MISLYASILVRTMLTSAASSTTWEGSGPSDGSASLAKINGNASGVTKSPGLIPRIGPTTDSGKPVCAATFSADVRYGITVTSGTFANTNVAPVAANRLVTSS